VVALHCGLRQGELFGLRWDDVDLEDGTLRVNRTLSRTKDGPAFTVPKTIKNRRTVRLTNGAIEALKRHSERQTEEMVRADTLYEDQGLVFASEVGTHLNGHNVCYLAARYGCTSEVRPRASRSRHGRHHPRRLFTCG
jgi:integrase